jgi:peroxiredoxin
MMKQWIFGRSTMRKQAVIVLLLLWIFSSTCPLLAEAVPIGSRIADFELPDLNGKTYTLKMYEGKTVVLIFWSYKCPVSLAYNERMLKLRDKFEKRGVILIGVDACVNESAAEIRANISNMQFDIPILLDKEGTLADSLGAMYTPSVFIIDRDAVLRYRGALDNNRF